LSSAERHRLAGDKPGAILPYSFAKGTAQANGKEIDVRNGTLLGSINGVAPAPGTINETAAIANSCVAVTANFCASPVRVQRGQPTTEDGARTRLHRDRELHRRQHEHWRSGCGV
jgi:hypothetical protein